MAACYTVDGSQPHQEHTRGIVIYNTKRFKCKHAYINKYTYTNTSVHVYAQAAYIHTYIHTYWSQMSRSASPRPPPRSVGEEQTQICRLALVHVLVVLCLASSATCPKKTAERTAPGAETALRGRARPEIITQSEMSL